MTPVLIVDDDANFRGAVRAALEPAAFSVLEAETAEEALECLERGQVRVALIDLDLPRMNGSDLIRVVARRFPAVSIVATSGVYQELYLDIARNVGARVAVRKLSDTGPLPPGEWVSVISSAVGGSAGA
jgi:CheY-like chemotaxis protein